MILKVLLVLNL